MSILSVLPPGQPPLALVLPPSTSRSNQALLIGILNARSGVFKVKIIVYQSITMRNVTRDIGAGKTEGM